MKKITFLIVVLTISMNIFGQNIQPEQNFGISFSGFVKNDFFFDSRQTVDAREGHFLLWPAAESLDMNGEDINAESSFNFLSIQTRLTGKITGPDAFGAKTSGMIEGAFFGHSNGDINGFRLRHAYIKLNWENTELLMGQYWHPLFETSCFPDVVSFNTGAGIQPFSRNPQIRFTYKSGKLEVYGVAFSERDFTSRGPAGVSSQYIRNAGIPALHAGLRYSSKNEDGTGYTAGAGAGMLSIQPEIKTTANYITDQLVTSLNYNAYIRINTKPLVFKLECVYGGNMANLLLFGGYGVSDFVDITTGEVSWEPINNLALWTEIQTTGKTIQVGLFAGMNLNMGSTEEILGGYQGLSTSILSLYRISPRIVFNSGKFRFAIEAETDIAAYGDGTYDLNAIPQNTKSVVNQRVLFATYLFF